MKRGKGIVTYRTFKLTDVKVFNSQLNSVFFSSLFWFADVPTRTKSIINYTHISLLESSTFNPQVNVQTYLFIASINKNFYILLIYFLLLLGITSIYYTHTISNNCCRNFLSPYYDMYDIILRFNR